MDVRTILCVTLLSVCWSAKGVNLGQTQNGVNAPDGGGGGVVVQRNVDTRLAAARPNNAGGNDGNQDRRASPSGSSKGSQPLKLAEYPECRDDVQRYCRKSSSNNFAVLECLQNDLKDDDTIDIECQHVLWQYKSNLTKDMRYESAVTSICRDVISKNAECAAVKPGDGFIIPCLINYIDDVTDANCRQFLLRMKSIVFSDYRLIYKFVDSCQEDITLYKCGRIDAVDDKQGVQKPHDQGKTLSCLAEQAAKLKAGCRQQLLRVAELQADDYHNDRQLYFACRDDRERLCANVRSGNGDVYKCLYRHKFDPQMSNECRKQLSTRQKLQREDYKVNQGVFGACRQDIRRNSCEGDSRSSQVVKMSSILLCLEQAVRKDDGTSLAPECVAELKEIRRSLLEDFEISPEIAHKCQTEIQTSCQSVGPRNVIHCLMDLARPRPNGKDQDRMSDDCKTELKNLLKEADIDEDYSVDPVVQEACHLIVINHCPKVTPGEGRVYGCLMSLVDKPDIMSIECKEKLMEIEYFVARDFRLSVPFVKKCSKEMEKHDCILDEADNTQEQSITLMCLYRKMKTNKAFDPNCAQEMKRLMADRAKSVDLEPEIEQNCMQDLMMRCVDKTGKNEEMNCLEDNLEKLSAKCKEVVEEYTERADDMPELNQIFAEACQEFWKENCKDALSSNKEDENADALMNCLIENKNHDDMNPKCRAGIEHHQLITMENFRLSRAFKEGCKADVESNCGDKTKKSEVISCLSSLVHEDALREQRQRVSIVCRKQLKFELLQRSSDIRLDPELKQACQIEYQKHCREVNFGTSEVIECLRAHQANLGPRCHQMVFRREKEEADDPTTDFNLMTKCKKMIKKYCLEAISQSTSKKGDTLVTCLVQHKEEEEGFDEKCAKVLLQRLRVRAHDVRLNPDLMRDCKKDIKDHCNEEMRVVNNSQSEAEGRVLFCLRKQFALKKLTHSCTNHVSMLIKESVLDYVQDINLVNACGNEIKDLCADAVEADKNAENGGNGEVLECLRQKLLIKANEAKVNPKCITEVIRSLTENKADVHLDPLLYRACALDLRGFCKEIPRGDGRQMSCLLSALNDKSVKLQKDCQKQLSDRVQLWDAAAKMAPPESMSELLSQVYESEARTYLVTFITLVVMFIFIGGLCCGRVTKRVAQQLKNK